MNSVRVLPEGLIDKIRAGEVIERPASVLKELIENSLDAGARRIEVEIGKAGKKLVSVFDDGEGMSPDDARLSLMRHATSKIRSEEDLLSVMTMGFRGEALPSIASVARLALTTAPRGSSLGICIETEGGKIKSEINTAALGTTVSVRDIFFNTPARKKFLKSDHTELAHILDWTTKFALAYPAVAFSLKSDGFDTLSLPPASGLKERLSQIYGTEFSNNLLEARSESAGFKLTAFVSGRDSLRESRANQMIFINSRPVRDRSIAHAIYAAYEAIPKGRHPVFFLFLDIDPSKVDSNSHPQKLEVRLRDLDAVYGFVKDSLYEVLGRREDAASSAPVRDFAKEAESAAPFQAEAQSVFETTEMPYSYEPSFVYLGDTFVAIADGSGLTLLDHHAAHERVLYERLLNGSGKQSARLLFPVQVELSPKEYMTVLKYKETLMELGIEVEDFGRDTVLVRGLPPLPEAADPRGIISDAASALSEGSSVRSLKEEVASRVACHGSVRGRRILSGPELASLIRDLNASGNPDSCPHGRPTRLRYSLGDLKKLFGRK